MRARRSLGALAAAILALGVRAPLAAPGIQKGTLVHLAAGDVQCELECEFWWGVYDARFAAPAAAGD
jgi:hypothetical protein